MALNEMVGPDLQTPYEEAIRFTAVNPFCDETTLWEVLSPCATGTPHQFITLERACLKNASTHVNTYDAQALSEAKEDVYQACDDSNVMLEYYGEKRIHSTFVLNANYINITVPSLH